MPKIAKRLALKQRNAAASFEEGALQLLNVHAQSLPPPYQTTPVAQKGPELSLSCLEAHLKWASYQR